MRSSSFIVLTLGLLAACLPTDELSAIDDETTFRIATAPTNACQGIDTDLVWPISGASDPVTATDVIQDVYGAIIRSGNPYNHGGVDFRAPVGTPIHAVADGFVTRKCAVGQQNCSGHSGKGNWLLIQHHARGPNQEVLYTAYAHMSSFDTGGVELQEGDCVAAGDVIGEVGQTGDASTVHLHLSLHANLGNSRSPTNANSLNPWLVLPEKPASVGYTVSAPGPDSNGDLQLHVEVESQYANLARIELARLQNAVEVDRRTLAWNGAGVMTCGPDCGDIEIEATDFDPGDYQSPYNPNDPPDAGDSVHVWDLFIAPKSAGAGDEIYRIFDVHGDLVASGSLD